MNTAKVAIGAAAVVLSSPAWAGFSVDENTGEAHYTYDVLMPQARGRYQPSLTLMYGSSNLTDSGYGFGWALSGDWIETQQLASGSWRGVYVHNGSRRPLLYSPARGGWVPEVRDGSASPLTVTQFGCTTSTGYDAEGNQYQFVSISSASGVGCTGIQYLWTVTDLDGNTTNFQWTFYPQSYPTLVSDVGVPPDHYLTQITYNLYDSGGTNRRVAFGDPYATSIDLQYSVVAAVGTTPASVTLNNVRVTNQGNTLRRYEFAYGFSSNPYQSTPTSLRVLQSITEHGQESGVTFAPTSFAYSSAIPNTIVTPTGATYNVEYLLFRPESTVIRAVTSVKITGPGIDTSTTAKPIRFFYQAWVPSTTSWFDQTKEMIGYSQSYVLNTASNTVRMTTWETTAHAFRGVAAQVEWGPATNTAVTPPAYSVYQREVSEHTSVSLTGTCVAPTAPASQSTAGSAQDYAGVPSDFYPAIAFTSRRRSATFDSGTEFAREVAIACNQLDIYGNVRQRHVDPDVARAGDDFYQNTTFVIASAPTSPCKSCVATETRTADAQQTNLLASTRYTYDATTWNVSAIWKATDPSVEARLTTFTYNPNGAVASKVDSSDVDAISTVFTYDAVQLRPTRVDSQQGGKTLTTEITYDAYGRQVFVRGPYLGTPDTGQAIGAAYDELDRPIAIARGPISGITVVAGIAAFQYSDFRASAPLAPASVTSFAFAVPVSYTLNSPPQTSDARQTITYFDALGRKIQVRERMGGASSAITSITQNLAVFRVSGVIYDSAGRIAAEIEPFYSSSGAFLDYRTAALDDVIPTNGGGLSTALHARLHTYDDKSREVCSAYAFVPSRGIVPAAPTSCQSNFTETAGYVRATATCYRAATEKTPAMLAVKTIEPQLTASGAPNCASSPRGPESFFDGSGTLREARDIDGNVMQYTLDLNRNVTGFVRSTSDGASSVAVSLSYDMAGRVKHRTDPDIGTYDYSYFDSGRLRRMTLAARPLGGGISGSNYLDLSYDMGRLATRNACSAQASGGVTSWSCAPDTYVYDSPYVAGAYSFVAGRLAYAQNANSTIAFGYSPEGAILVRDQMLKGLSGVFSTTSNVLLSGQPTSVTFASSYTGSISAQTSYDSALRPVQLTSGATVLWSANSGSVGAYDSTDRVASSSVDNGLVASTWTYAPNSALESSAQVKAGSTALYSIDSETYRGLRLTSFNDGMTGTTYSYWYTDGGRLKAAKASTAGSLNSLFCVSFNRNKLYTPGASLGNLERIREQASAVPAVDTYNYSGTDIAVSGAGPDAPVSISTQSQTGSAISYDYSGRIISKASGAEQFAYDVMGRLTSVTRANDVGEVLSYDPMGQIVGRLSGSTLTYYVGTVATLSAPQPAGCTSPGCALDASSALTVDVHMSVGTRRTASMRVLPTASPRVLYYHRGRLGSVVATSTGGGVPGAIYRYDPYGKLTTADRDTGDTASELGYTGRLRLSGGLYIMGARVYDAKLRQFLQPDALNPMSYTYAGGDPINFIDPTGRSPRVYEPRDRESVPTIDHTQSGDDSWIPFIDVSPSDIVKGLEYIWDGIKSAANWVGGLFGGGDDPPPPPPPQPTRYRTPAGPDRGDPDAEIYHVDQAGSWWFNMWGSWGGSSGGPTAGKRFPRWIRDFSKSFGKCAYCDRNVPYEDLHTDHVTARVNGGNAELPNAAPACALCNWLKGALGGARLEMLMQWLRNMKGAMIVVPDSDDFQRRALHPFPTCSTPTCDT